MTATVNPPNTAQWQGSDVDVTTIEREVGSLWRQLTHEASLAGAVRTSIFNLVVYADSEEAAGRISDTLDHLSQRHPSRVIILVGDRTSRRCALDGSALVRCQARSPAGLPLCYEELVVVARGRAADHPASVVVPLLLPELPTYLWWPGQPPFGHRMLHRLLAPANQLVIDSAQFSSPADGLANLARLTTGQQGVHDFHWARLTPWRDIIAQFFDGSTWLPYAEGILSIRLELGSGSGQAATAATLLLVGWMASQLGWEPETTLEGVASQDISLTVLQGDRLIPIEMQFRDRVQTASSGLTGIELVSQPKGMAPARFTIHLTENASHASVKMEIHEGCAIERTVPFEAKGDAELLADEMGLVSHDRLYDTVVSMASRMAGREVWVPV